MAIREIPTGSVEIQTGLYLYESSEIVLGETIISRELFSSEGYCFWEVRQAENYDEDGNLKPENERMYAQYASLGGNFDTVEKINANFISVPVQQVLK